MRPVIVLLVTVLLLSVSLGCSRKQAPPPGKLARVSATKAFESYFGPAPTTDKGTCYAFVIYFPNGKEPGKVTPFPFFSFDEDSLKRIAVERLIGGLDDKTFGDSLQLFPKGSRLLSLTEQGGQVTANFSKELRPVADDPMRGRALQNAVTLTLMQFRGVTAVQVQSEGGDLFLASERPLVETSVVVRPAAPRLLGLVGMQEGASAPVKEVDALFDRPVEIKEFQFLENDGTLLAGDMFHSMFDMAAVLKPKDPKKLAQGTRIRVRYKVVDKLGRPAAGETAFTLDVRQHQD